MGLVRLSTNAALSPGDRVFLRFKVNFAGQTVATILNRLASDFGVGQFGHFFLEGFPVWDPVGQTINMIVRVTGTPLLLIIQLIIRATAIVLTFWSAEKIVASVFEPGQTTQQQRLTQCEQLLQQGRFAEYQQCIAPTTDTQIPWGLIAAAVAAVVILPLVLGRT